MQTTRIHPIRQIKSGARVYLTEDRITTDHAIGVCRRCKTAQRIEIVIVERKEWRALRQADGRLVEDVLFSGGRIVTAKWQGGDRWHFATQINGSTVFDDMKIPARCECGRAPYARKWQRVAGKFSAAHKCGSRCRNAKGGDCECECGGQFHGCGHD